MHKQRIAVKTVAPFKEGVIKNNQVKPKPNISPTNVAKPPAAKPKKK